MVSVPGTQYATPYVLQPGPGGDKPYVLMRQALSRSGKAAVGKVALHRPGSRRRHCRPVALCAAPAGAARGDDPAAGLAAPGALACHLLPAARE
ncbi:hypothetical protein QMK19_38350 [Streptomyces sp. H10-C2]|uniref:hypothetical protein n=1 Tax=unclassified Streptomyces TaxID=2593676 RepID=UPI0024B89F32|nr:MULTISPECIES: hypothetical protein [unclassified Streptomyces]MDJ0347039.1 hypothetical protein [Streptomyces sp. PH10-H1]MDJ0375307.1 hypothetical protein [Streptomyces sp. H10-C2]